MIKQSKLVYVIGSIVIGIITIIAVVAGLMLSGVIDASSHKLVFISKSEEIVYTGQALVCNEYEIESGELKAGHTAEVVMTGSQTEVGESQNTYAVAIYDENGADVTVDYEITTHYGTLKVLPKPLSVKSGDATEEYNGEAVKNSDASISAGELMEGHTIEYIMTGSRTDAGKGDNTFVVVIRDKSGIDVTKNYAVNYTYGVLEVLPMEVAIQSQNKVVEYDGKEHAMENDQWTYVNNKRPEEGLDVEVYFTGGVTGVGTVEVKLASVVVKDGDRDVSFNYDFTYAGATVEVKSRKITLVSGSAKKEYDGTELVNKEKPTLAEGSLADGHDVTGYVITGSQTEIGYSSNTMNPDSIVITDGDGNVVNDNYEITVKEGTLTVTEVGGNQLKDDPNIDDKDPSASNKDTLDKVVAKVTAEHDGAMYLRKMSFKDYGGAGSSWSVAPEYSVLLGGVYSMNYLVGEGLKNREVATLLTAKIEPVETAFGYALPYYYSTINTGGSDIQTSDTVNSGTITSAYYPHYYNFNYTNLHSGHLEEYTDEESAYYTYVTENYLGKTSDAAYSRALNIIYNEDWKKSDTDIIQKVCSYVQGLADYDIDTDIEEKETDVILAMLKNTDKKYTALCRHYAGAGVALFRALGIPARYTTGYMISAKNGQEVEVKVKDGHAWVEIYLQGIGWIPVECTASESGGSGSISGKPLIELKPVETRRLYTGEMFEPIDNVTVVGEDWNDYKVLGYNVTAVDVQGARSEVGKGDTYIVDGSVKICDGSGTDVTDQFEITLKTGKIHIYKYTLTLTTKSAEKVYDGEPLIYQTSEEDCGYSLEGQIFEDYTYAVQITGKLEKAGTSSNTAKIKITDKGGNDVTDHYLITYNHGTLKITRRQITIKAGSMYEVYETGKVLEIAADNYELTGELAKSTHFVEAKVEGSLSGFGQSYTKVKYARIYDKNGSETVEVTDQYEITYATGILKMTLPE